MLLTSHGETISMKIGILGINPDGWGTTQLESSLDKKGISHQFFGFSDLAARVGYGSIVEGKRVNCGDLSALFIRLIGRGSLEEIIFRMDLLHTLSRKGLIIVNSGRAIERCVDKYYALTLLHESGLPVPRTMVTESIEEAVKGFCELGMDVVLKPLFGSKGFGSTRISDIGVAERVFSTVRFHRGLLYLQEFIPHSNSDIRVFVIGDDVVAAMRRVGESWKTNVSKGAKPVPVKLSEELKDLAIKAAMSVDCKIAGVDILESENGPLIIELNSQPGWHGLQSVTHVNIADCITEYILSRVKK